MTLEIASLVKSLGDFPLDPDAGESWLWSGDGATLLWMSRGARVRLGVDGDDGLTSVSHGQALQSFAAELGDLQPDRQPIRVKQVPLSHGRSSEVFTCLCRHVPLADGAGFALLTVAIGAPPRLARPAQARAPEPATPAPVAETPVVVPRDGLAEAQPVVAETTMPEPAPVEPQVEQPSSVERPVAIPAIVTLPTAASAPEAVPATPAVPRRQLRDAVQPPVWISQPPAARRPLRFVWQTDGEGRFAHLSRELADAVGGSNAAMIGKDWATAVATLGLGEAEGVSAGLASGDTFTASPVFWPVVGTGLGVPVELAGLPVREKGVFTGFRGYGIVRIERAVERHVNAVAALADDERDSQNDEDMLDEQVEQSFQVDRISQVEQISQVEPNSQVEQDQEDAVRSAGPAAADQIAPEPIMPDQVAEPAQPAVVTPAKEATLPAAGVSTLPEPDDTSFLSPSERNAFREIARALGREVQDKAASQAQSAPEPMPLSPRQMPAWIAKRQQARQEVPLAVVPSTTPVVPFEALQARLERRNREPVQIATPAIIDKLPLAVLVMQHGKPIFANRDFLELVGQRDFESFLAHGGIDRLFTAEPVLSPPGPVNAITIRSGDGKLMPVEAQVQAITWEDMPASLMTFRRMETSAQAKSLELELQAARAELRELRFVLDTATDGVLSLDGAGRILAANRSAEALFGFDQNEITGEPFTLLLEPDSHPVALDYLEGLKTEGVATIMNDGREVFGRERHGGRIPLFMTLGRMGDGPDQLRFCAVLRDVTIWKKAEAELTDARRAAEDSSANKTDFLARVSHEIRTPMNAIIGFADVMRTETFGPLGNERYRGYVNDIHSSGLHVVSLVNDLLDLSKVASGKLELSFGSVDINQAVVAAASMIQPQANAGKVIVRTQLSPSLPPVVADERSLRQIVLNLLSNAAKFTEAGGQVIVTTALTERGEAVIRVRDTGIGMSPEELQKAIEPFRQIPGPKSEGGTGLGLPLTKALAEANRATFAISSEPGKGTLAEVVFPSTRVLAE